MSGIDPGAPTPDWMAQRLALSGMRPISLAVDITNYVMLELGRPIHGYDADKLQGPIRVRRATEGERLTTLDGVDRALSTEDLVVTDDSGIIGLGGVMGGETTEMSSTTTRVLVEAAHWDAVSMFRTGKRHKLTSEAGKRNERGVDPVITPAAADRVVELLVQYGGGTAEPGVTVVGEAPAPAAISMASDLPARISGIDIPADTTVANLEKVGCLVGDGPTDVLLATPPTWRPDLTDPYDLVEEVVRVVGYDQVPSVVPREAAGRGLTREQRLRRRIGRTLAGAGCVEVISFPFVGEAAFDQLGLPAGRPAAPHGPAGQPALDRGAVVHHDAAARPAPRRRPQPRPRDPRRRRCSRPAPWRSRSTAARRRSTASTGGRPTRSWPSCSRRSPSSRCTWPSCWPASASEPAGGAPGVRRAGRTRSGWSAGWATSSASRSRWPRPAGCPGTRAAAPRSAWAGSSSATPASCTRTRARRSGCRPAPRPSRSTSTS